MSKQVKASVKTYWFCGWLIFNVLLGCCMAWEIYYRQSLKGDIMSTEVEISPELQHAFFKMGLDFPLAEENPSFDQVATYYFKQKEFENNQKANAVRQKYSARLQRIRAEYPEASSEQLGQIVKQLERDRDAELSQIEGTEEYAAAQQAQRDTLARMQSQMDYMQEQERDRQMREESLRQRNALEAQAAAEVRERMKDIDAIYYQ